MHLVRFVSDTDGSTAIEYGLIAALIAMALVTALTDIGTAFNANYDALSTAMGTPPP